MDFDDLMSLCLLLRRSHYDVLQAHVGGRWSTPISFAPCDPRAAEQAVIMLRRLLSLEGIRVRHARRARLRTNRQTIIETAIITILSGGEQVVLYLEDARPIDGLPYLSDASMEAIEAMLPHGKGVADG